jgi:hypothetical protein
MNTLQHIFRNIFILSLLASPFLPAADSDGPAGAGSGASGPEGTLSDTHKLLDSDEAIEAFEGAIISTIRQFMPTIKLTYPAGSVLSIMQIIAEINMRYEEIYKDRPITRETPIQQYVHGDMASTAFFLHYAQLKRNLLKQTPIPQMTLRDFMEGIASFWNPAKTDILRTLPNVALIRQLSVCIQRCEERQKCYAPLLKHIPKEDRDSDLKALLGAARSYVGVAQIFSSDARHMMQNFLTDTSTEGGFEPAPAGPAVSAPSKASCALQHPILQAIKGQITLYCAEKHRVCDTTTSKAIVAAVAAYLKEMTPETFASQLYPAQHTLLAHSKEYPACAQILSKAKNKLIAAMKEELSYSDEELATITHSLIYALATDLIYSHFQHYETPPQVRRNIREHLGICPPGSETPWHQDIVGPSELPHFRIVATIPVADIMDMVHRWAITDIIKFLRKLLEKKSISPEDASAMDAYLINTLLRLRTYVFSDEQKATILRDERRAAQNDHWHTLRKAIREKQEEYDGLLLTDLLHQTIIIYMLALLDADNMPADTKSALKGMPCFQLPKAPKVKKGQRRRK